MTTLATMVRILSIPLSCALIMGAVFLGFPQISLAEHPESSADSPVRPADSSTASAESSTASSTDQALPLHERLRERREERRRRAAILDRLRAEGEEAALAFAPLGSIGEPQPLSLPSEEDVSALLSEVLDGLGVQEGERIRQAVVERQEEQAEELGFFGAADHLLHPSTDLYKDPLKALTKRPALHLEQIDPRDFDYPIVVNARVQDWMVYFLTRGRGYFTKWLARAERYRPLILPMLKEAGMPEDLIYQAMIESGFNPYATSRAQAVGVWQFISSTGRAYGLKRDWWIDERRDPVQATVSAIAYMSALKRRFGNWELASAAYNAGQGKISRAIKRYGTRNLWELSVSSRTYLKPETKNYVPKIIAAAILGKYADRYGLADELRDEDRLSLWEHDVVPVDEATDLSLVARLLGISLSELEAINPALRRGYTPPGTNNYPLNVPLGRGALVKKKLAKIPERDRRTFVRYAVRRGDTLGRIAQRYGVPISIVQRMNQIRDPRSLRVGQGLLIPVRADNLPGRSLVHVVARGETLSAIARRYGMKLDDLREKNRLGSDSLRVGQELKVRTGEAKSQSPGRLVEKDKAGGQSPSSSVPSPVWHVVKKGDSLTRIAERYGKSVSGLRKLNGIGSSGVIHPGDRLRLEAEIPEKKMAVTSYSVASGDTVSGIAARFGMTSPELLKLNGLSTDRIRVGQRLKVRSGIVAPVEHVVSAGDSLFKIARRYRVPVESIQRFNRLRTSTIRPGQRLKIPGNELNERSSERSIAYLVQDGDTLWGISQKYGVSVQDLKGWNDLRGDRVRPGQELRVLLR